tara:strand:+ start:924 stop:1490 length:567 start_codon:yes stop_codon:yes gene_type:complete
MIRMTLGGSAFFAALLAATSALAECDLKIADLTARMEQRRADTVQWEQELDKIDTGTSVVFSTIMDHVSSGDTCPNSMTSEISDKVSALAQIQRGNTMPRDGGIDSETANTFGCISEISKRLEAARANAVDDNNSMQLLRYNNVADTLATLDRGYTKVLVDAKAAQMRGRRIDEMLDRLTALCSEMDF